jgi:hypothetical protein
MPVSMKRKESGIARTTMAAARQLAEEGEEDRGHERGALEQIRLARCESSRVDEIGAVVDDADLDALGGSFS